jgi:hypothetical protein
MQRFLTLPMPHEVFVDFPIEGASDDRLGVELVGESNDVGRAALDDAPPDRTARIQRIGPYPAPGDPLSTC